MSEKCQRCGEVGDDRRTLWMACLYEMNELPIPFEVWAIQGYMKDCIGSAQSIIGPHLQFAIDEKAIPREFRFFTLRVCKQCRGAWMGAIATWFTADNRTTHYYPTPPKEPELDRWPDISNFMERLGRWIIDTWRRAKRHRNNAKWYAAASKWLTAETGSRAKRKALDVLQRLENERRGNEQT